VEAVGPAIAAVEQLTALGVEKLLKPIAKILEPIIRPFAELIERLQSFLKKLFGVVEEKAAETAAKKVAGVADHELESHVPPVGATAPPTPPPAPKAPPVTAHAGPGGTVLHEPKIEPVVTTKPVVKEGSLPAGGAEELALSKTEHRGKGILEEFDA